MSDSQNPLLTGLIDQLKVIIERSEDTRNSVQELQGRIKINQERQEKAIELLEQFRQTVTIPLQEVVIVQGQLNAMFLDGMRELQQAINLLRQDTSVGNEILRKDVSTAQDKLRAALLAKMDGLQGTMDLVRQDVRNSWNTADFALSNSRNIREESDKLLNMISTMQRQQQLLTSQVEELRRNAADKGLDGPPI